MATEYGTTLAALSAMAQSTRQLLLERAVKSFGRTDWLNGHTATL